MLPLQHHQGNVVPLLESPLWQSPNLPGLDAIPLLLLTPPPPHLLPLMQASPSLPHLLSSGHSQPTVNTCHNLDIHDAASLPLLAILGNENVSVYSSSEDDSSMFIISTTKKITSRNEKKTIIIKGQLEGVLKEEMGQLEGILKEEMQQIWTVNHHLDAFLLLPHW